MYCIKCGEKLPTGAKFCTKCGAKQDIKEERDLSEIIIRLQQGDKNAFEDLYLATQKYIRYMASINTENKDAAEDIVQDIYLAIYKNINTLEDPNKGWGWIKTISRNITINFLKKESKYVLIQNDEEENVDFFENLEEEDVWLLPEATLDKSETSKIVANMIEELPKMQKMVVLEHYYNERKLSEIAEEWGLNLGTVKSYLAKARKKIESNCLELKKRTGVQLYSVAAVPILYEAMTINIEKTAITTVLPHSIQSAVGAQGSAIGIIKFVTIVKDKILKLFQGSTVKGGLVKTIAGVSTATLVGTGVVLYVEHDVNEVKKTIIALESACRDYDAEKLSDCFRKEDKSLIENYEISLLKDEGIEISFEIKEIELSDDLAKAHVICMENGETLEKGREGYLNLIYESGKWKILLNEVNRKEISLYGISSKVDIREIIKTELVFNR